jgi:XTP/dITP diphosphohydrolase
MRPDWFPPEVVVATHNSGKLSEWRTLLGAIGVGIRSAASLGLPEPDETESTYRGNARLKASIASKRSGMPSLADDTGFEASRLGGEPGVLTAPWVVDHGGYPDALHALIRRASAGTEARLVCAVALATPGSIVDAEAYVTGTIASEPSNAPGFAAILESTTDLMRDGVLAHRRAAFERLISR